MRRQNPAVSRFVGLRLLLPLCGKGAAHLRDAVSPIRRSDRVPFIYSAVEPRRAMSDEAER